MTPLLWLDLETTDLDPIKGAILEAAWLVTDQNLNVLSGVEYAYLEVPSKIMGRMPPIVRQMHTESGLLDEWVEAVHIRPGQLTARILKSLAPHLPEGDKRGSVYLAGSNCDFERRWMERWFSPLGAVLSHRCVDVSRLRTAFTFWTDVKYEGEPDVPHRALFDILDHLGEARFYREVLITGQVP